MKQELEQKSNEANGNTEPFPWKLKTWSDIEADIEEHKSKMESVFKHDQELGYITINASYPYHIELSRIPDPEGLVHWVEHLAGKDWMTGELIREFIQRVYAIKGWDLYRRNL